MTAAADLLSRRATRTSLREKEARYQTMFECAPDGILVSNAGGRFTEANPSICHILRCGRDDLLGADAAKVVVEPGMEHVAPPEAAFLSGRAHQRDWVGRRADGSAFPAEVVATRMADGGMLLMVRDVTDLHAAEVRRATAERAAREMQAELARFARLATLGEFVATIAHEVNQPLAALQLNCDAAIRWLAADPPNVERTREAVGRLVRDSSRANQVIRRVREFAARGETDFVDVDLNDAIRDILRMTSEGRGKLHVVLEQDLPEELPRVLGNAIQLQQVVLNLVSNAAEAMGDIGDRARILTVRTEFDPPGTVRVSVRDTGTGFDSETAGRLFEHFFTTKPGGAGLGLRISLSIVEAHGGRLWAEPLEPYGALFQFTVPAVMAGSA